MSELLLSKAGQTLLRFPLNNQTIRLGRGSDCDLMLADDQISREHLILHYIEGVFVLKCVGKAPLLFEGKSISTKNLKGGERFQLLDWEIFYSDQDSHEDCFDDTYVSVAGAGTQIIDLTQANGHCVSSTYQLNIQEPGKAPRQIQLTQEVSTLGTKRSCDIMLEDSFCSDTHAKLIVRHGKITVLDLGSTNGTFINGIKIREAELDDECILKVGQTQISLGQILKEETVKPLEVSSFGPMVGKSKNMQELYALIQRIAASDATACVLGETGVGKELVARSIHDLSGRRLKPFVAINCGAISSELIESELFGHEKGAFTGAQQQHKGVFEQADGGTLFLDEMGELPLALQATLLRALENGKIRRVGGNQEIPVNVRVVCATHRDLTRSVQEGRFREDLFFRLYVFPLYIPALRERKEDIPLIAKHFVSQMSPPGKSLQLSSEALHFLQSQNWPGNVRELKNSVQRAVVLCQNQILSEQDFKLFPTPSQSVQAQASEAINPVNLQDMEKQAIIRELKNNGNNRTAAARSLGIAKSTLYEKLKIYGIS